MGSTGPIDGIDDHGDDILAATSIQPTSVTEGNIEIMGDEDYFALSIPTGGVLVIESTGISALGALLDSAGNSVGWVSGDAANTGRFVITHTTSAGDYYVRVSGWEDFLANSSSTGSYTLISTFTADVIAEPDYDNYTSVYGIEVNLSPDAFLSGTSDEAFIAGSLSINDTEFQNRYLDVYQFTLENDSLLSVNLSSLDIDTIFYLLRIGSSQEQISLQSASGTRNNSAQQTNLQAGTYWVAVSSEQEYEVGAYELEVTSVTTSTTPSFEVLDTIYGVPVEVNPNPFIFGELSQTDADLGDGSYVDLYQFTVATQVTLQIDLESASFDSTLILVRIFADQSVDNTALYQNDDFGKSTNSRITQTLSPGTYWIAASSFDAGSTGDYQISIVVVP